MTDRRRINSIQDAINFAGNYGNDNSSLRRLFKDNLPNYSHIVDALLRGSGRPPAGAWTRAQVMDFFHHELTPTLRDRNPEDWILWALLLRHIPTQKALIEAEMAKLIINVMQRKKAAGQSMTPEAAAQHLVRVWQPDPDDPDQKTIDERFLLVQFHRYIRKHPEEDPRK